jgi:serine-type D-Ala-D-Ala carboxypeptidase/endopeptidase
MILGCLVGLVAGVLVTCLMNWALTGVEREQALWPLADLKIPEGRLGDDETKGYIDRLAHQYVEAKHNVGLVVGIIKGGRSHVFGYGSVSSQKEQPPDGDTVFELASVGKTFTATLLADLCLNGEVSLDDPITAFLPADVRVPGSGGRSITLLDLATHHSGLPSLPGNFRPADPLNPYADYTVEALYRGLEDITLSSPVGTRYAYSNLGFGLLGQLLESRAKRCYEDLVVARICDPLGMAGTRMTLDESLKARLASPHDKGKPVSVWEDRTLAGAGSFLSTAHDMLAFVRAHLGDGAGSLGEAMRLAVMKRRPTDRPATAIGLGWHIDSENALDIVWHNGGSGGSRSYVAFLPASGVGVVVLSNSSSSVDGLGKKLLYLLHLH